jgi:hypothetical protein
LKQFAATMPGGCHQKHGRRARGKMLAEVWGDPSQNTPGHNVVRNNRDASALPLNYVNNSIDINTTGVLEICQIFSITWQKLGGGGGEVSASTSLTRQLKWGTGIMEAKTIIS